jgi:two-component system CheB/CheR fusion protein
MKPSKPKPKPKIKIPLVKANLSFPVVGIGASAGGLDAFKKFLKAIPENSGMAYVLVQHLNPNHESLLPELLQKVTEIPVSEIKDVVIVEPDHIYIIPENKLLVANDGALQLIPRPPKKKNVLTMSIDLFFTSLAEVHQNNAIGVVLSGTASDGTQGLRAIRNNGGITFAQDEASAAFDGMPHSAAQAGVVDFILPPEKIPEKILELVQITNAKSADGENISHKDEELFRQILSLLRIRKGTDFTYYKQTTIRRRILRRMAFNKIEVPSDYLKFLREHKPEQDILYQDLLIPVTSFFRDPKSFENICQSVFPRIIKNKPNGESIRVWVAGCSTGEEAYSIAICLKEFLEGKTEKVQIFATDISEPAIAKAREGIYTKSQMEGINPQRLQEFFNKVNGNYQVKKSIRDMCIFALHNFLKDPPFGKMDFVSCRNVLIYMEPYLQKKALTTFHYSLNTHGFLLLGKSETTSSVTDLFTSAGKNDKLFTCKDVPGKFMLPATQRHEQSFRDLNVSPKIEIVRNDFQKTADDIMLSRFSPAGVVVNEAMDIVYFRGNTSNYLEQTPGKPTHNLLKMAKQGLSFELRNILHKTKKDNVTVIKEDVPVEINGRQSKVTFEAIPLSTTIEPHYLVLFHETQNSKPRSSNLKTISKLKKDEKDQRIQQLENELAQSREDMRGITEDQEAANEELQSANEELLSGSEELQSLNEELETGKEELQSTNEELTVLNNELINLNEQLTLERNFSDAVIDNLHEPLIVLDEKLRIKICNHAFYKTFLVNEIETEGRLIYELGNKQWDIPELRNLLENILPQKTRFSGFEVEHDFPKIGHRIMILNAQEIIKQNNTDRMILLAIGDITEFRLAQGRLKEKNTELERMNRDLQSFSYVASHDLQEPLRKIQTFSTRLLEKETENLSGTGKEYFHRMQDAALRMQGLIEDLLSFSRVSNIEKKFEITDINEIVEDVKKDFKEIMEDKNAVIVTKEMCAAKLIPFQFRQLMQNLIFNSIKFSKPGKAPHITITSRVVKGNKLNMKKLLPEKEYCHISVKDKGIGFEPEFKEKIFEVFQRLHGKDEYPGSGIGLAIVKKIVDNHNGMITAKSEINKGAAFDIYFPAL